MTTYTFNYPGTTVNYSHTGGQIRISASQRGVQVQTEVGGKRKSVMTNEGSSVVNKESFYLPATNVIIGVGPHVFGGARDPITVEVDV